MDGSGNLTTDDVATYTSGRLAADDPLTLQLLNAGLGRARRFCGWHVTPVISTTVTVRGSGEDWLALHTLKIVQLTSIVQVRYENGVDVQYPLDLDDFEVLSDESGVIYWKPHRYGRWNCESTYIITFSHGYTATEAASFNDAVLEWIDSMSESIGTGGTGPMSELKVDDVDIKWDADGFLPAGATRNNPLLGSSLYQFRILGLA